MHVILKKARGAGAYVTLIISGQICFVQAFCGSGFELCLTHLSVIFQSYLGIFVGTLPGFRSSIPISQLPFSA